VPDTWIDTAAKKGLRFRAVNRLEFGMPVSFTSHNIRLDDGSHTKPEVGYSMDVHPWFLAARRILDATFPGDKRHLRIVDLGCLEGGYTVEFARLGMDALGIDVRELNIEACRYVQSKVNLPNLRFAQDDVWNIAKYGVFDAVFCCGLFYHLDKPREFLKLLSQATKRLLILQTHFSEAKDSPPIIRPRRFRRTLAKVLPLKNTGTTTHKLSLLTEHEGLPGRWLPEFRSKRAFLDRENRRWASWNNKQSFWIQREFLLQSLRDSGFDLVLEQFDGLGPDIAYEMTEGSYRTSARSTFIGIKTSYAADALAPAVSPGLRQA
jgi:2-polyprenyl-3-methyl-5-hydroxy-6-metoxy-1,4-benzoquinol methylase